MEGIIKKKFILLSILTGLLIVTGTLFYLSKIGILKIGADTTTTVTAPIPDLTPVEPLDIGGIKFATITDPNYHYDMDKASQIIKTLGLAEVIENLKNKTGQTNSPEYFLVVSKIDFTGVSGNVGGATYPWSNIIILNISGGLTSYTITHEFGHLVDWNSCSNNCWSSDSQVFLESFSFLKGNKSIAGYLTSNNYEFFAEFFTRMFYDPSEDAQSFPEYIKNYLFKTGSENDKYILDYNLFSQGSFIYGTDNNYQKQSQNSLMFAYKFVANKSRQPEIFPGRVDVDGSGWVASGHYMEGQAIVSFRLLDHAGVPMEKVDVNFGGSQQTTSEDINLRGTYVFNSILTGQQTIAIPAPPSYYPVPFAGQKVDLKPGSNYVEAKYRTFDVSYAVTNPQGAFEEDMPAPWVAGSFVTKGDIKVEGIKKGSIPRYPDFGPRRGFGTFDPVLPQNGSTRYYKISYLIGGDDEHIFPVKATIKGPGDDISLSMGVYRTITDKLLTSAVIQVVRGIWQQKCFDDPTKPAPLCGQPLPW